ncbi:MAG: NAD(+) synthase [Buchananella hordeovulneris]|nr:NAD(+) synthase [Buchananella hordeovulneris]
MSLRIALAQIDPVVGDFAGNVSALGRQVAQAAFLGANVVFTSSAALTGAPVGDLLSRPAFRAELATTIEQVAQIANDAQVMIALHDGTEPRWVLPAGWHAPAEVVLVESLAELAGLEPREGAAIYAVLAAAPASLASPAAHRELVTAAARRLGATVAFANLAGGTDDVVFGGGSLLVGPDGAVLARAPFFASALVCEGQVVGHDLVGAPEAEIGYLTICAGLSSYCAKNGITKAILGLSGGIDSALAVVMAADVLGGRNVIGVSMPSEHSSSHSLDDAALSAAVLGVDYRVVPIAPMVAAFSSAISLSGLAAQNIQARVRGSILMGISNEEGGMVLATGNRTEVAVGYSTIYGDTCGGYAPLGDAPKTLVWQMSRWRNEQADLAGETPPIPESSITKPPSAELAPGQQDSDSLPPYSRLDPLLADALERQLTREELVAIHDPAEVDHVLGLVRRAEWKRRQYAPAPRLYERGFQVGREVPISSRWLKQI